MQVYDNIPLPGNGNEAFKDVMDYFEKIQARRAQQPLRDAQAKREAMLANLPFGGHSMPGAAGEALALQTMKKQYGENSPEYQEARNLFDLRKRREEQTMSYQQSLMDSQPRRFATQAGKTAQEQSEIDQGYMPGTTVGGRPGQSLAPDQQKKLAGQYGLKVLKNTTDPKLRERVLYARNMEKTLDNLNVNDLTSYSGLKGAGELISDKAAALKGNPSERYTKYSEALTASKVLAKQVRQFYGDSITPSVQEDLAKLTNPTSWLQHPDVAKSQFNKFKSILNQEKGTFINGLESPDAYTSGGEDSPPEPAGNNIQTGRMTIIDSNGEEHTIRRDKLDEARSIDPGLKVKKEKFSDAKI